MPLNKENKRNQSIHFTHFTMRDKKLQSGPSYVYCEIRRLRARAARKEINDVENPGTCKKRET